MALVLTLAGGTASTVNAAPAAGSPPLASAPAATLALQTAAGPPAAAQPASDPLLNLLMERGVVQAGLSGLQPALNLVTQARDLASEAVIGAMAFLGLPYARGGNTAEGGFDCSGFTRYVYNHTLGLLLPRSAEQQAQMNGMLPVAAAELKPGDLVFFNTLRKAFSHVGIYVGDGRFVHSPREGAAVRLDNMQQAYWAKRFDGARRPPVQDAQLANPGASNKR